MNAWRPTSLQLRLLIPLIAASSFAGCRPADEVNAADSNAIEEATLNLPSVPLPRPPMDRAALLAAVARAASAAAAGEDDGAAQRPLDGARFEFRIRFGCGGPAPQLREAVLGWAYDRENRTLRVRAMPTISLDGLVVREVVGQLEGADIEAVEGFWVPRPWLLDPVCPAVLPKALSEPDPRPDSVAANRAAPAEDRQESEVLPPVPPRIGIAHFFSETDPRTRRRQMRAYETVKTLTPDQPVGADGFDLVLSGRLRGLRGRSPVICLTSGPDRPPDCIVSADFDRVWIERADTREVLAQWGTG